MVGRVLGEGRYLAECFVPMVVGSPRDLVRMGKKYTGKKIYLDFLDFGSDRA